MARGQIGVAPETTYATYAAPTKFYEPTQENVAYTPVRKQLRTVRSSGFFDRMNQNKTMTVGSGGDITIPAYTKGLGFWLKYAISGTAGLTSAQQSSTIAYKHTFVPGSLDALSFTYQRGIQEYSGTNEVYSYLGSSVHSWKLSIAESDFLMFSASIASKTEDRTQTLATASYPSALDVFTYQQGGLTVGGSGYTPVKTFDMTCDNMLKTDRIVLGGSRLQPVMQGNRKISGTLTTEYVDTTLIDAFRSDAELALVLTFTGPVAIASTFYPTLKITLGGIKLTGPTPVLDSPDNLPVLSVPWDLGEPSAGGTVFSVEYTSTDVTP